MQTRTASPRTRQSSPKVAHLHRHDDGRVHALSSDGLNRYAVRIGEAVSCTWPGFTNHGRCYHVATAVQRFAAFWLGPVAVIVQAHPDAEPPGWAAPAVRPICGNCGEPVSDMDGIPPFTTIPGRPGVVPWWRCPDYAGCVARGQRARLAV